MIKICRHIIYGHIGRINLELSAGETFPAQYGIYWFDGQNGDEHANRNRKIGLLPFWNDQDSIEIIETINEEEYQLKYKRPRN